MNKIKITIIVLSLAFLGAACTPGGGGNTKASDGGVWLSQNNGENWEQRALIYADRISRKTMADVDIQKLLFSPKDTRKIFAVSRERGLWVSWNGGNHWDLILSALDVSDIVIHPENPKIFYAAVGSAVAKTENEGDSFHAVYISDNKSIIITSLALAPDNPNAVYAATNQGNILLSEDAGGSWREIGNIGGPAAKLAFHPVRPELMYAGVINRGLAFSDDGGKNWLFANEVFAPFPGSAEFRDFAFMPTGIIYASAFGLLRTLNFGKNWAALPLISGDKDSNIYSLAVNPRNPLEIYYGTRSSFYRSLDGGFNWIPRELPTTRAARAILINPNNPEMLYLGTGRVR